MHLQLDRLTRIFNSTPCPNLHFSRKPVLSRFEIYNTNVLHKKYVRNMCKMRYASCFSLIPRVRVIFRTAGTSTVVGNDSLRKRKQLTREIQYRFSIYLMRKALTDRGLRISRRVIFECRRHLSCATKIGDAISRICSKAGFPL